ncbi:MAG TPA: hypothetical protein VFL82_03940 [Thermomicrobiales bacterium]|jgi:hypothetical protein|nr:hypothetical protein [Thermomicrobiales bacterium]
MATVDDFPTARGEVKCSYHPNVMTGLRCSRCGKPICPRCGVRTPVGLRCPDCAGVRGLPTYRTDSSVLAKSALCGLGVAVVVGVIWGYLPTWGFYLSLALGFGVAEAMAWASRAKRGLDLQIVGMLMVVVGLVISRAVLAQRLGIPWELINQMAPGVQQFLNLELVPDGIFAALSMLIVWLRFR